MSHTMLVSSNNLKLLHIKTNSLDFTTKIVLKQLK